MNVLCFFPSLDPRLGGTSTAAQNLCHVSHARGATVRLATFDAFPQDSTPFDIIEIDGRTSSASQRERLLTLVEWADVVHLHSPWYPSNWKLIRIARRLHTPCVLSLHGMLDPWSLRQKWLKKKVFLSLFGQKILRGATRLHCTAEQERQHVCQVLGRTPETVDVIPLPVSLDDVVPAMSGQDLTRPASPTFQILFMGRLHPVKNLEVLLDAADLLKQREMDFHLVIAGPGEPRYVNGLHQRVQRLQLQDRITFAGLVQGDAKRALLYQSQLFVLPSKHENFGLAIAEAMFCGMPVITTKNVAIWQELQQAGAVICQPTAESIVEQVEKLQCDEPLRNQLGSRGQDYVRDWLATDRIGEQLSEMYRKAMGVENGKAATSE